MTRVSFVFFIFFSYHVGDTINSVENFAVVVVVVVIIITVIITAKATLYTNADGMSKIYIFKRVVESCGKYKNNVISML